LAEERRAAEELAPVAEPRPAAVAEPDESRAVESQDEAPAETVPDEASTPDHAEVATDAPEPEEPAATAKKPADDDDEVQRSRYERNSAKLPRIGDDAANVVRSLESFRQSLRGS
jgi:hypothetical protein